MYALGDSHSHSLGLVVYFALAVEGNGDEKNI